MPSSACHAKQCFLQLHLQLQQQRCQLALHAALPAACGAEHDYATPSRALQRPARLADTLVQCKVWACNAYGACMRRSGSMTEHHRPVAHDAFHVPQLATLQQATH
jgi:hypothetical protein